MRIALITLAVAALAFIGSIIWMVAMKNGISLSGSSSPVSTTLQVSSDAATLEILKSQWKTEERIKELEAKIETLSKQGTSSTVLNSNQEAHTNSGETKSGSTITTSGNIVPISAKFLTKILSKVSLSLVKNNGIFGLYIFDENNEYSTYQDNKYGMTVIASRTPYETWVRNWKAINPSLYTTNETTNFPFKSFFVNPIKDDGVTRVVLQVESQTLMISFPKNKYTDIKNLLSKK